MISFRKAYHAKVVRLSAVLLSLLLPLASLASCGQLAPPLLESLKLGIPAAALQSPVQGPLPDVTELRVGIGFKIDPQVLNLVGQQPLRPEQPSDLEQFARRLGISDGAYQKIAGFFNLGWVPSPIHHNSIMQSPTRTAAATPAMTSRAAVTCTIPDAGLGFRNRPGNAEPRGLWQGCMQHSSLTEKRRQ